MSRPYSDQDVFRAVADPTRRRVLQLLQRREQGVSELAAHFECSTPTLSVHLRVLRSVGLVTQRRVGRRRIYTLHSGLLEPVNRFTQSFQRSKTR